MSADKKALGEFCDPFCSAKHKVPKNIHTPPPQTNDPSMVKHLTSKLVNDYR